MRFRLWTILWVFALFASAMATFGPGGLFPGLVVILLCATILRRSRTTFGEWLTVFAIICVLVALLLPAVSSVRGVARRVACTNNMKQIALALHNYVDTFGSFPAASQSAPDGEQLQSWRLWICPFLESSSFFDNYKKDEPWNGPDNTKLVASTRFDSFFECPAHYSEAQLSHYLAVVGEHTAFPPGRGRSLAEFTDGTSNTILFIEAPHKRIPWAKPEDLSFDEAVELLSDPSKGEHFGHEVDEGFFYKPSRGINVAFVDGWVQFLRLPISREHAAALLTVDGGEVLDHREVTRLTSPELDYGRIYSLSVFLLLSLLPLLKLIKKKREIAAI
ncbi:MAG: DUF1559 domain-containing protein [Planctomycetes bacterium]|nr:DUF1559 domain-containing protein [Planctomycetota bacterium]